MKAQPWMVFAKLSTGTTLHGYVPEAKTGGEAWQIWRRELMVKWLEEVTEVWAAPFSVLEQVDL